jgi:hypothetical protein
MKKYIWGTGRLVGKVIGKYIKIEDVEAFVDNNINKKEYLGKKVISPEELVKRQYDAILVANTFREEISKQCLEIGICMEKIIFLYNNCVLSDVNKDYSFVEKVLGKEYAEIVKNRYHIIREVETYDKKTIDLRYTYDDYVRIKCFELTIKEIYKRDLAGSVAEVGVYQGEFARYINAAFPKCKLYLFDTFDGFDTKEALKEINNGNCTEAFVMAYRDTNVKKVIEKMPYLEQIVIKQGYFPESLEGLEDVFKFVSIDVDFEDSIYSALEYFYPRIVRGGYIFVHDYNSSLRGVEVAVDKFENKYGYLRKMPLCDANGTLVIMK